MTNTRPPRRPDHRPGGGPVRAAAGLPEAAGASEGAPEPPEDGARRGTPTGRAAVLALVLAILVVALALPVRGYLAQRSEIAALEQRRDAAQAAISQLQQQTAQWSDSAYVATQARQRLHYVFPGETGYVVLRPKVEQETRAVAPVGAAAAPTTPWFTALWDSARAADAKR